MITVSPVEQLEFKRPFTSIVKESITITNYNSLDAIAFKVKTTAPKTYCVRPNSGKLQPGQTAVIQVLLQAMKEDPPADFKCKDKFLIQSVKIPQEVSILEGDELAIKVQELWAQSDTAKKLDPSLVDEIKLRCIFLPADVNVAVDATNASSAHTLSPNENSALSVNPSNFVHDKNVAGPEQVKSNTPNTQTIPADNRSRSPSKISPLFTLSQDEVSELKQTIKKLTLTCEGYKTEIERLNILRQRKTGNLSLNTDQTASTAGLQLSPGVPVQTVALVAFISFLFGVLFF